MVKLKFFDTETAGLEYGIRLAAAARGFEIAEDGVPVHVSSTGEGLVVSGDAGKYTITYEKRHEFFRAVALLVGMLEGGRTDFEISEQSRLEMCGAMIDCSRNAVPKADTILDLFAKAALMGMNCIMLYTEDTYEVEGYEYFGYMRGRYSAKEMKLFDEAAASLGIDMIPCIQTLAHLSATLRWEYSNGMRDTSDILLIDEERTYEFIESMFRSLRKSCSSKRIHIGMDEAHDVGRGAYMDKNGYHDRFDILSKHVRRVCKIAEKYDFKPMMWSDMFFRLGSAEHDYYETNPKFPENITEMIPENISMVYWDYYNFDESMYKAMIEGHRRLGREVIFAGGVWKWCGMAPGYKMTFNTTFPALAACRKAGLERVFATMWGDDGGEVSIYTTLLGMQLYAEYNYYENPDMEHLKDRFALCLGLDAEDVLKLELDDMQISENCCDNAPVSRQVLYQDVLLGLFDKNFESFDLEKYYDEKIKRLDTVAYGTELDGIFDYYRSLTRLLRRKCMIGVKIRKAYNKGDKKQLSEYADELLKLLEDYADFHEKAYIVWMSENKPFGFDKFEIRLGGTVQRIKTAERRIREFCRGEIEKIDELEEKLLYYGSADSKGKLPHEHAYRRISSVASEF
ncbi:MAG: family 20 glycosylhydrolase [Clostridia bacterium]|nr:family 20 glycosylhydrolase [Clostridia bacterium]